MTDSIRARVAALDLLDRALLGALIGLGAVALAVFALPGLPERIVAPSLDLALDSVALVTTSIVATLAWIRFREGHYPFALYQGVAFLVLAITYLRAVVDTVGTDPTAPLASGEPGHEQLYVFVVGRIIAAALLVVGGLSALRGRVEVRPAAVVLAASAVAIAVALTAHPAATVLPALIATPADGAEAHVTSFGSMVQLAGAALFLAAVVVCRRLWQRDRSIGDGYVAVGLLFAAFALVIGSVTPGSHPGPVTVADGLWFAFNVALLLAVEAEARTLLRALRQANATLEELRAVEVSRAALEERSRLSRELHDGLTQDLWLAKLKIGRLSGVPDLGTDARALVDEATHAIDQGLAEAHQAVMAMRIAAADGTFGQLLLRYIEDFEDRFGLRVQLDVQADLPDLPVRTQAELLRIAQEALTNVHRHSGARSVAISVAVVEDELRLSVMDDGDGFIVGEPGPSDFGLMSMRERAALIGGNLRILSQPGSGTHVSLTVPLGPADEPSRPAGTATPIPGTPTFDHRWSQPA